MKLAYFVTFLVAISNSNLRSIFWVHSTSISVQKSNLLQPCCPKERRQLPNLHDRVARSIRFNRRPSNELDKLVILLVIITVYIQIHLWHFLFRAFRFKNKRQLKNLMILDQGGCPHNFPGVGDASYIKDLMTEEIVSKDFSCSIFGPYSHPIAKIGWVWKIISFAPACEVHRCFSIGVGILDLHVIPFHPM